MSVMTAVQFAAAGNRKRDISLAMSGTHDLVIANIARSGGRRTTGVKWTIVPARHAGDILDAAGYPEPQRSELLAKLAEFAPAVLVMAEADYEPLRLAQGAQA